MVWNFTKPKDWDYEFVEDFDYPAAMWCQCQRKFYALAGTKVKIIGTSIVNSVPIKIISGEGHFHNSITGHKSLICDISYVIPEMKLRKRSEI